MNETGEALSERAFNLLAELSLDPAKLDAWLRDPAAVMTDAGLSPVESAALLRRLDADRRARAAPSVQSAFFVDPGDDPEPNPDPNQPEPNQPEPRQPELLQLSVSCP